MSNTYRYPGARPFTTGQQRIFYGREREVGSLSSLIGMEQLVVLFSKSGMGKSSLLNAGIVPKIQAEGRLAPFDIRFRAFVEGETEMPLDKARNRIQGRSALLGRISPKGDDSLWLRLKSRQLEGADGNGFLLIFDQFEELFTYPEKAIDAFAQELSELLFTNIPNRYREELERKLASGAATFSEAELQALHQPMKIRVVMAIRSDRMSLLNKLKAFLPHILENCYELQPLSFEQAEDAILLPAFDAGNFTSPRFDYEDEAVETLIGFLSEQGRQDIESFQLQILCEYLEKMIVIGQKKKRISSADIENPGEILENYYLNNIAQIQNAEDRLAARRLIEEGLIFDEEERRLSLYEGQILRNYQISPELLRQLLDTHLIRSEPSMRGGYTYELSHDTLVAPVLKAKARRLEAERREKEAEEQRRREAELAELRREAEEERERARREAELRTKAEQAEKVAHDHALRARRRARQALIGALLAIALAAIAIVFFRMAKNSEQKVQESLKAEEQARQLAEQNAAKFRREIVRRLKNEAQVFLEAGQASYALERLEEAFAIDTADAVLKQRIENLKNERDGE
ncbi:MAG: ATP-binding protein [Phaeodactylibacter sp.]|nr:ATP-binding protein [Phaeodactylibacter sp.]MCB9265471.1 ATP-binding protein [Lewinellaceae bacterium]MCB9289594.1 ATP-binding protein [Lewinellaceae bacterium]